MKYAIAAGLFLLFHTCTCSLKDNIIINNTTDIIPNITVYPSTENPTVKPIPTTTLNPNTTTVSPNTTTHTPATTTHIPTTTTVHPNSTTVSPSTTPVHPNSTTVSPHTTTTSPHTTTSSPNITTVSTTTPHPNVTTPISTTPVIPTTASPHPSRKFDGPSFVGGIVLATGLMAIGFIAFKFYKARAELNYHTL